MADWKDISKIDAHIHILPEGVIAANQGVEAPGILAGGVEEFIKEMDRNHIEKAILMPYNDPFLMSMEFHISAVHRNMMDIQKRYPDRFLLFADMDVRNPIEETMAQLEEAMASGAFCGIKIHPSNTGLPLDGEYFEMVFAFAEQKRIPVEVHCYPKENCREDVCSPSRLARVLKRHPGLRVSVAHLGGFQYRELAGLNVWINFSAFLPDLVKKVGTREANKVLRMFPVDRLIFGTDYPESRCLSYNEIYPRYFEILDQMDFSQAEMERICRKNVLCFLAQSA